MWHHNIIYLALYVN